jgi:hypothetical protein
MAALKAEQLECLLDFVIPNTARPLGVFPANCIPLRRGASAGVLSSRTNIANATEHHPQPELGPSKYFDSLSFPISVYDNVHAAMSSRDLLPICVRVNTLGMIQSTTSTVCGHFYIAEQYWRSKHTDTRADRFPHVSVSASTSPDARDKFIVDRLRTITS